MIVLYWNVRGFGNSNTKRHGIEVTTRCINGLFGVLPSDLQPDFYVECLGLDLRRRLFLLFILLFFSVFFFFAFLYFLRGFWPSPPSCIFSPFFNKILRLAV